MKLNIVGNIWGTSGYANHIRGLANALMKIHDVKLSTGLPPNWEREINDQELLAIKKSDDKDRHNIIIDMPHNWPAHLHKEKNYCFLVWEGDKIPLSWIDNIKDKRVTQVWLPSIHVFNAIKNSLSHWQVDIEGETRTPSPESQKLLNKIKIVPHGVNLDVYKPTDKKTDIFTFLMNKGFRNELDRGGVQYGIQAFLQEFKKGEAKLIIKLNPAYTMPQNQLIELINKYVTELKLEKHEIPEIVAVYENLTPKGLNDLYNQCDVFLNPTGGEAFSLPCIEAMATGKPVITTNFGGQTDYVTYLNGWLIDYELNEVKHEVMYEGISWAIPNIETLRNIMRSCCEANVVVKKSKEALKTAQDYTWDNSASKSTQYLKI